MPGGRRLVGLFLPLLLLAVVWHVPSRQAYEVVQAGETWTYGGGELSRHAGVPFLRLRGSSYEMGLQYGVLLKEEIAASLANMEKSKASLLDGLPWYLKPFKRAMLRAALRSYAKRLPSLYTQELAGMAEGSGQSFEDFLYYAFGPEIFTMGCSALLKRIGDRVVLARNLDYAPPSLGRFPAVVEFNPTGRRRFTSVGLVGYLGVLTGINDAGVGIALTAVNMYRKHATADMPIGYKLREILESAADLGDVDRILDGYAAEQGWTLTVCNAGRDGAIYDLACGKLVRNDLAGGDHIHVTNAFYDYGLRHRYMTVEAATHPTNLARYRTIARRLKACPGGVDGLIDVLADASFCGREQVLSAANLTVNNCFTLQSVVLDPAGGGLYFSSAPGFAGFAPFFRYDLQDRAVSDYRPEAPIDAESRLEIAGYADEATRRLLAADMAGLLSSMPLDSLGLNLMQLGLLVDAWAQAPDLIDAAALLGAVERIIPPYEEFALVHLWRAAILLRLGRRGEAVESLEKILALPVRYDCTDLAAHALLAEAYYRNMDASHGAEHAGLGLSLLNDYALGREERRLQRVLTLLCYGRRDPGD